MADTDSNNLFINLADDAAVLVTWGGLDTPDTTNWALLHATGASVLDATGDYRDLPVEVFTDEYGGAIQADDVLFSHLHGGFNPEGVLRFRTGDELTHSGVFELVRTGMTTISELDADGDPVPAGNTNTTIGVVGTGNATATLHHAPVNSMAYLAIQFNSDFEGIRGTTAGFAAMTDAVTGSTDIEYTSIWDTGSVTGVATTRTTFIDRVAADGATETRRFGAAKPTTFDDGDVVPQN